MPRLALLLLLASILPAPVLVAQEEDVVQKYERYLATSPYHERVFLDLVEEVRGRGELSLWIERYAGRNDLASQVIHARLLRAAGREEEAIEVLSGLESADGLRDRLLGELELARGERLRAVEHLTRALGRLEDYEVQCSVALRLAEVHWFEGDGDQAEAVLETAMAAQPGDLVFRREVARVARLSGDADFAIRQLEAAIEATRDPADRSGLLTDLARLQRGEGQSLAALEAATEARDLLREGHWRHRELSTLLISLHRQLGSLQEYLDSLDPREDPEQVARVHLGMGDHEAAIRVLKDWGRAANHHRLRIEIATRQGSGEELIAALQVAVAAGDEAMRSELAEVLTREGHRAAAAEHWMALQAEASSDIESQLRLAGRRAAAGDGEGALADLEATRLQAPEHLGALEAWARIAERHGHGEAVLAEFAERARTVTDPLEQLRVAGWLEDAGELNRAEELLRRPLGDSVAAFERSLALGRVLVELGRMEEARDQLRLVAAAHPGRAAQCLALTLESYAGFDPFYGAALEQEHARATGDLYSYRVVAALLDQAGDWPAEREWVAAGLERHPTDRLLLERCFQLDVRAGDLETALGRVGARLALGESESWQLERARLLLEMERVDEALAGLNAWLGADGFDRRQAGQVVPLLIELGATDQAIQGLESLAHREGDVDAHLRLAQLLLEQHRPMGAVDHWIEAYERGDDLQRRQVVSAMAGPLERLAQAGLDPTRVDEAAGGLLRVDLVSSVGGIGPELAFEKFLKPMLEKRPYDPELLRRAGRIGYQAGEWALASQSYERLVELGEPLAGDEPYEFLLSSLNHTSDAELRVRALACPDPQRAARELTDYGRPGLALECLRVAAAQVDPDPEVLLSGARMLARHLKLSEAREAYERYLARVRDQDLDAMVELASVLESGGDKASALEVGQRMARVDVTSGVVREWFFDRGRVAEWAEHRHDAARRRPTDDQGLESLAVIAQQEPRYPEGAWRALLSDLEQRLWAEGVVPPGRLPLRWGQTLRGWRLASDATPPEFGDVQLEHVGDVWDWLEGGELSREGLETVEQRYGASLPLAPVLAGAWLRLGEPERALALIRAVPQGEEMAAREQVRSALRVRAAAVRVARRQRRSVEEEAILEEAELEVIHQELRQQTWPLSLEDVRALERSLGAREEPLPTAMSSLVRHAATYSYLGDYELATEAFLALQELAPSPLGGGTDWNAAVFYALCARDETVAAFDIACELDRLDLAETLLVPPMRSVVMDAYDELLVEAFANQDDLALKASVRKVARVKAELLSDVEGALALWTRAEERLAGDPEAVLTIAVLADRCGDFPVALASRTRLIQDRRVAERVPCSISHSPKSSKREITWVYLSLFASEEAQPWALEHLLACLRLELELGRLDRASEWLDAVCSSVIDPPDSWVRNLSHAVSGYALGEEQEFRDLSPLYGRIHELGPKSLPVVSLYVQALFDAEKLDQAATVLESYLASGSPPKLHREELERQLKAARQGR